MRKTGARRARPPGSGGQRASSCGRRGRRPGRGGTYRASRCPPRKAAASDASPRARARSSRQRGRPRARTARARRAAELVAGRNSVVEALRAAGPRHRAVRRRAHRLRRPRPRGHQASPATAACPLLEAPRAELDRMTGGAVHQGLALQVPPYDYAHPGDLLDAARESGRAAAAGRARRRDRPAQPRRCGAFGGGVRRPRRARARATLRRHDRGGVEGVGGCGGRVPVARATNLTRALLAYRDGGLRRRRAGGGRRRSSSTTSRSRVDPLVVVVGSEGKGLSRLVGETCDVSRPIPMHAGRPSRSTPGSPRRSCCTRSPAAGASPSPAAPRPPSS